MEIVTYSLEIKELEQEESMPAGNRQDKRNPMQESLCTCPSPQSLVEDAKAQGSLTKELDPVSEEQFAYGSLVKSGIKR